MSFSRNVGNFVVSGQMREPAEGSDSLSRNDYLINEYAKVSFGGLDFILSNDANNPLLLVDEDGGTAPLIVNTLNISNDTAHFVLSDGAELVFYTQKSADTDGLLISGILPEKASALQLPYLPSAFAKESVDESGQWRVNADNVNYIFSRQPENNSGRQLILSRDDPMVFYHAEPDAQSFNPAAFIVRGGMEKTVYEDQLKQWMDKVYAVWEYGLSTSNSEAFITAYLAEAAYRGTYQSALTAPATQSWRTSPAQTYLSAPFLGRLDIALRTLAVEENSHAALLSQQIRGAALALLSGQSAVKSWTLPAGSNLIKAQGQYAGSAAPSDITLAETVGIIEGYNIWPAYMPNSENPFNRLLPRAVELISEGLIKDNGSGCVFVIEKGQADVAFNLRLGIALSDYGDANAASSWAGIGRSLVLSVLALTDDAGQLPAFFSVPVNEAGETVADEDASVSAEKISASVLYPYLPRAAYYPHAIDLGSVQQGVWAWTASQGVTAALQNNVLDINVSFPVGWTHHLLIRGVPPFTKIQLRDMDYRSDPRFEQYNSPGWVYSASTRTLLVKLVHRSDEEHIRIFY
jgi:hypothetical protein